MRNFLSICFVLLAALVAACGGEQSTLAPARPVIGVSLLTTTNPFFNVLGESVRSSADRYGYDVILTSGEQDVNRQKNQVSDFIVRGVAAIVLTPVDSRSIATAIREANDAGIPVFTADVAVLDSSVSVVSHVATDNYQAGQMAAVAMIEALGGEGQVGIVDYPEVESVMLRTRGFLNELERNKQETGKEISVVSRLNGGGAKDRGFRVGQDMIQAHPALRGIFAINDPSALGAVAALEEAGRAEDIVVVSIDGQPEGKQAIKEGKIYADAVQFPERIGEQTVDVIMRYMNGESVPSEILISTSLYKLADALADSTLN
jgi:ribose transport system substrate-binding protein